jgi:hypothetical protein
MGEPRKLNAEIPRELVERIWMDSQYTGSFGEIPVFEPHLYAGNSFSGVNWDLFKSRYTAAEFKEFAEILLPPIFAEKNMETQLRYLRRNKELLDLEIAKDYLVGIRMVLGEAKLSTTDMEWIRQVV